MALDCGKSVEFFRHVQHLKTTKRSGWLRYDIKEPESIASHMYGVALLSMILSQGENVDTGKVLKMSLIHDLAEALAGDITPHDKEYKRKRQIEEDKLKDVVSSLPENMRREILCLDTELAEAKTLEAKIVGTADRLDMALTAAEYEKCGLDLSEFLDIRESDLTESGMLLVKYLKGCSDSE